MTKWQFRMRNWLGIFDIIDRLGELERHQMEAQRTLNTIGPGLGRVIAKLDAKYGESKFTPERKAESDKLAEETLRRLAAEAKAREPYND